MPPSALPLLFYNLGGEMLYVLDQRLKAQNVAADKAQRVLSDIVSTMFKPQFLDEMLKSSTIYSKSAMRTIFNKLVHASIMRVNKESMDKLFDLMLMAAKYQIVLCGNQSLLLHITLNHLDAIMDFIADAPAVRSVVISAFQKVVETYGHLEMGDLSLIRQLMMSFLQDTNNKVSIYLTEKVQNDDGKFVISKDSEVPFGTEIPGTVTLYDNKGQQPKISTFVSGGNYKAHIPILDVSNKIGGARATKLGTNIYLNCKSGDIGVENSNNNDHDDGTSPSQSSSDSYKLANAELDVLAKMVGKDVPPAETTEFRLNIFANDGSMDMQSALVRSVSRPDNVLRITASNSGQERLTKILDDLNVSAPDTSENTSRGEDLLSLMDSF